MCEGHLDSLDIVKASGQSLRPNKGSIRRNKVWPKIALGKFWKTKHVKFKANENELQLLKPMGSWAMQQKNTRHLLQPQA